jgi:threonine synthase
VVFSVSSGNFGNLTGGLLAQRMGLPVDQFIASTNINDSVPVYLRTAAFNPHPSRQTISNAMDVGNPSNFARMQDLFNGNHKALAQAIEGHVFTDQQTSEAMRSVYKASGYVLDPHGAVGYLGLKKHLEQRKEPIHGVFLETAHPGKFLEVVENVLETRVPLPATLQKFMTGKKQTISLQNDFTAFKSFLESI